MGDRDGCLVCAAIETTGAVTRDGEMEATALGVIASCARHGTRLVISGLCPKHRGYFEQTAARLPCRGKDAPS